MRIGILVRSEDRGLGSLSRDFYTNLHPDKTLVVIPAGARKHGLTSHLEWYPDATHTRFDGHLHERTCREFIDGLDVVLSFETFYDWRFCRWADQAHVATVCYAMPEYWRPAWASEPTQWWAPTSWRIEHLPPGTRHVPVPVPAGFTNDDGHDGPFRWLHVGGARLPDEHIHADRNGTTAVLAAASRLHEPQHIIVRTQSPGVVATAANVTVIHDSLTARPDLYRDADALVLPRRYAGLSLPVLEAFAAGLPVVMTDMAPQNTDWSVRTVSTRISTHKIYGVTFPAGDVDRGSLVAQMDRWASHPEDVNVWRDRARDYATANTWTVRAPQIRGELERAADLVAA